MTYTGWRYASRSRGAHASRSFHRPALRRGGGTALVGAALLLLGCADKFSLPPVPEAEIPETGAYNVDRIWSDMGEIEDMLLGGGSLYTLTRRNGEPRVEVWLPEEGNPTPTPLIAAGQPIQGLRRPTAIARNTSAADGTSIYVADARGADLLESSIACPRGATGCFLELHASVGGANRAILARPFEPVVTDFVFTARVEVSELPDDGVTWLILGTAPGRIGVWLEIESDIIRPVRSDGAFPIPTLPFEPDSSHDVEVVYHEEDEEYDVTIDGELLDDAIPTFHRMNAPIEILGLRVQGEPLTVRLDDVAVTPAQGPVALSLDFEDPADGESWVHGPYFTNDPAPAILRFLTTAAETTLEETLTDPAWLSVEGIAVAPDRTLYVSVQERDPEDNTGVLRRGQVHRFAGNGERLPAIAETGTGLGFVTVPKDLDFDGENLLVADEALNRVQKLDPNTPGTALFQIPPLDVSKPWFSGPTEVTTDNARFIYVADTRNDRVMRYTPEGAFADTVYSRTYGPTSDAGDILSPIAIAATETAVWIADQAAQRLVILKRAGEIAGGGE